MIETFNLFETNITFYVLLNLFFCLFTTIWLLIVFLKMRYLFIKPSMLLIAFSHIFFQWPMTIYSGYYENFLPSPYTFALLIHAYILAGLLIATFSFCETAAIVWRRITDLSLLEKCESTKTVVFITVIVAGITVFYLSYVPFTSTGLYAIFMEPSLAAEARERSLKLLDNKFLQYAYSLMISSVAPLLAVMLSLRVIRELSKGEFFKLTAHVFLFLFLVFAVSLTGARISAVNLFIVILMAFFFHKGLPFKPLKFFLLLFVLLLIPAAFSIMREGKAISAGLLPEYLGHLARRTFVIPVDVGSWFVHYSQINGPFGVSAIPKLSAILGIDSIDAPNLIGITYTNTTVMSTTAGAGYLFAYYSYFGIASIILSSFGLWFLDVALLVYKRLSNVMILPCVAAASLSVLSFISSDYTVVWLTHGFGVVLLFAWIIDRFVMLSNQGHPFDPKRMSESAEISAVK